MNCSFLKKKQRRLKSCCILRLVFKQHTTIGKIIKKCGLPRPKCEQGKGGLWSPTTVQSVGLPLVPGKASLEPTAMQQFLFAESLHSTWRAARGQFLICCSLMWVNILKTDLYLTNGAHRMWPLQICKLKLWLQQCHSCFYLGTGLSHRK